MVEIEAKQVYTVECPSLDCPTPHRVVRDGWKNKQQRYECKGCGNHFFAEGKALYKQFPANQIAAAVDMYYSGMSLKQVAEHLEDTRDVPEPSKATVQAWVRAYTQLAKQVMDGKVGPDGTERTASGKRVLADVGDHWVADEMVVPGGRQETLELERHGRQDPIHPSGSPQPDAQCQRRHRRIREGSRQREVSAKENHHGRPSGPKFLK